MQDKSKLVKITISKIRKNPKNPTIRLDIDYNKLKIEKIIKGNK